MSLLQAAAFSNFRCCSFRQLNVHQTLSIHFYIKNKTSRSILCKIFIPLNQLSRLIFVPLPTFYYLFGTKFRCKLFFTLSENWNNCEFFHRELCETKSADCCFQFRYQIIWSIDVVQQFRNLVISFENR